MVLRNVPLVIGVLALAGAPVAAGAAERPRESADEMSGQVSVFDGDRILLDGRRIRLAGIDAPEPRQTCADAQGTLYNCGRVSEVALAEKLVDKTVTCTDIRRDGVAICRLGEEDLGAWLVSEGLAVAERTGEVRYAAQEEAARQAKRGLWAGSFTMPWDLRRGVRGKPDGHAIPVGAAFIVEPQAEESGKDDCRIKGNITREGTKLYWIPGSRRYAETVITERSGERWFCTEDEAKAAGWQEPDALAEAVAKGAAAKDAVVKQDPGSEECRIKGNITREGSKLYWIPGSRRYAETVITESSGERWFCTEDEARSAGWQEPEKVAPSE